MEAVSEVKRESALGKVNNVAFGGVNEDLVGKEVELELFGINFFAVCELGGGFLELLDPEELDGKFCHLTVGVGLAGFLFMVMERGGQSALGIFVHLLGADLEFDDLFVWSDDGGVDGLVAVLFGGGNIIFDAALHGGEKGMNDT